MRASLSFSSFLMSFLKNSGRIGDVLSSPTTNYVIMQRITGVSCEVVKCPDLITKNKMWLWRSSKTLMIPSRLSMRYAVKLGHCYLSALLNHSMLDPKAVIVLPPLDVKYFTEVKGANGPTCRLKVRISFSSFLNINTFYLP